MEHFFLGIDGGKSAGAGVLIGKSLPEPMVHKFESAGKAVGWLRTIRTMGVIHAGLEKATASEVMSRSNCFTFGENYGGWKWALIALEIPTRIIPPKHWQTRIPTLIANNQKSAHKRLIQQYIQGLYPQIRVTQDFSDALAIAEHTRYLHQAMVTSS